MAHNETVNIYGMAEGILLNGRYILKNIIRTERYGILYNASDQLKAQPVWIWELFYPKKQVRENDGISVRLLEPDIAEAYEKGVTALIDKISILQETGGGVVKIIDRFLQNGTFYYVMEAAESHSIREAAELKASLSEKSNPISEKHLMTGIIPVLETLQKMHDMGYIHYGITADSLIMDTDGRILLQGAGNPIISGERDDRSVHFSEVFSGSEIFDMDQEQGAWTDIYSLMSVLYYLLTGTKPPSSVERIFIDDLKLPKELDQSISADTSAIIMKGMALRADERYKDAKSVIAEIRRVFPDEEKLKKARRKRVALGLITIAAVAVFGGTRYYQKNRVRLYFKGEDTVSFYIDPEIKKRAYSINHEEDPDDVEKCLTGIEERVKVLTEGEKYLWDVMKTGRVRVTLPGKIFGDADIRSSIKRDLTEPWVITRYLEGNVGKRSYFFPAAWVIDGMKTDEKEDKLIVMPEGSLLRYHVQENNDPVRDEGLEWGKDMITFDLRTVNEKYLVDIEVDPEKAGKFFDSPVPAGSFNKDLDEVGGCTIDAIYTLSEDKRHMSLMADRATEPLLRTLAHNITSDPLPGYLPCIYRRDHITWQDPASTLIPGEKQVDYSKIKGDHYLICYTATWSYTWEEELKELYDKLGIEYAYGVSTDTGERCIACKMSKPIDMDIALLCEPKNSISIADNKSIYIRNKVIEQGDERTVVVSFSVRNDADPEDMAYTKDDKLNINGLLLGDCVSMTVEDLPEREEKQFTMVFDTGPYISNIWDMEQIVSLLDAHTIGYKRSSNTILQQIDKNGDVLKEDSAKEMAEAAD